MMMSGITPPRPHNELTNPQPRVSIPRPEKINSSFCLETSVAPVALLVMLGVEFRHRVDHTKLSRTMFSTTVTYSIRNAPARAECFPHRSQPGRGTRLLTDRSMMPSKPTFDDLRHVVHHVALERAVLQ